MNVILVEDSLAVRKQIVRQLGTMPGVQIVGEASGESEASEMIRCGRPDLVLLDLQLSPGNGVNVLRRMRSEGSASKVLVITNQTLDAYRLQCEALGVDGFHDKSNDMEIVMERIRQWAACRMEDTAARGRACA